MVPEKEKPAVCLLSGGMDSAVSCAEAVAAGFSVYALSFRYGQRHEIELDAAERVARELGVVQHRTVSIDLSSLGGSSLVGTSQVPKGRAPEAIGSGVPTTYVPARNTVFLSIALAWAEVIGARDLFLGVTAVDYSGYPDCRPEFLRAFEELACLATAAGTERGARFTVHAPLIEMSKGDIVGRAYELGVDLAQTHTCYDPQPSESGWEACGSCDACALRLKGFREAGRRDPIAYVGGSA